MRRLVRSDIAGQLKLDRELPPTLLPCSALERLAQAPRPSGRHRPLDRRLHRANPAAVRTFHFRQRPERLQVRRAGVEVDPEQLLAPLEQAEGPSPASPPRRSTGRSYPRSSRSCARRRRSAVVEERPIGFGTCREVRVRPVPRVVARDGVQHQVEGAAAVRG